MSLAVGCLVGFSVYLVRSFPLRCSLLGFLFRPGFLCKVVWRMLDAVCAAQQENVMYNVFLLPSVFTLTLFILRALYPLYTAALRNLREFERVKNDFLISFHISKTNRFCAPKRVLGVTSLSVCGRLVTVYG